MWSKLLRLLGRRQKNAPGSPSGNSQQKFSPALSANERLLRQKFSRCDDIEIQRVKVRALNDRPGLVVYADGLVNADVLNRDVVAHLRRAAADEVKGIKDLVAVGKTALCKNLEQVEEKVCYGHILLLVDGYSEGLLVNAQSWPSRAIEEPAQERTIRGPRDGFTETAKVNLSLVRRRLPTASLKNEVMRVGRRSKLQVSLLYIADVADEDVVNEVRERIQAIDIDGLLEPGALGELINERTITPFPLFLSTERPDKVVASLLEGKLALITEGSPFCMLVPVIFADFYHVAEDYYTHPLFATFSRVLRFAGLFVGSSATAIYTAAIAFHYEIIPRDIIVFLAQAREGVPFSPFAEAFAIEVLVELIREASIRLPGPIGPTIGIVGALVLGQAAVNARLVSPVLLIVVAIGLMANFNMPNYEAALTIRFLRFFVLAAAFFL